MYWLGLQPGDVHWTISSPGWAKHAWSCFFAPWNAGATVFVVNQPRFDAKALLATVGRCGVTTLCAPPTVWRVLILEDLAAWPVKLNEAIGAGEPLNPEVIETWRRATGITIRDGFGQTESSLQIGNPPGARLKPGSMGRPLPGYTVALLDPVTSDELARVITDLKSKVKLTTVIVTHDLNFALYLSDRVAMINPQGIVEVGTPEEIQRADLPLVRPARPQAPRRRPDRKSVV